jgi:hypothetical protein
MPIPRATEKVQLGLPLPDRPFPHRQGSSIKACPVEPVACGKWVPDARPPFKTSRISPGLILVARPAVSARPRPLSSHARPNGLT